MDQIHTRAADLDPAGRAEPPLQPTGTERSSMARRLARIVLWPVLRFFDPRFGGLAQAIEVTNAHLSEQLAAQSEQTRELDARGSEMQRVMHEVKTLVEADLDAATEAATIIGNGVSELRSLGEATETSIRPIESALERLEQQLTREEHSRLVETGNVEELGGTTAALLNYAESHRGFAAQRNLWFNWPTSLIHEPGNVRLANVNERIIEVPYAFRMLGAVAPGTKVLEVGASESTVALSLASLGYEVTAIDPRPYPVQHPRLRVVTAEVQRWDPHESFAAVVCISTLEHIGVGAYGQAEDADGDRAALERIFGLTEPGGLLVLTVPYGPAALNELERTYDRQRLQDLLEAWTIEDLTIAEQVGPTVWLVGESSSKDDARGVALITARRP
jgi:SAM-dependent methyltransferase